MWFLAILIAVFALIFLWLASRAQRRLGLPGGRLIYADTSRWTPLHEPLYDANLGLTGRPDYLVEQGTQVIPVEVKSTHPRHGPYDTHIYQLAAYCLLVECTYGTRPSYGILHYPDRTYRIPFTAELESAVMALLGEMRDDERAGELDRSHDAPARCARCGFNTLCDQRLNEKSIID
jgi:CRISPR-associated exonuclease Cas4